MIYPKGRHPGAVWRKTDFQIHTPRDAGWSGSRSLAGGTEELEEARETWADDFVSACLQRGIGAIAITDHHDIVMYPYVARAIMRSPDARGKLWLFPGMEVTCNDSVQCLILFDQSTEYKVVERLFGKMPSIAAPDPQVEKAPQTQLCGRDLKDLIGDLFEDRSLRGKHLALPHASQGGHKDILRKGFHPRFAELEVDGVYNEKLYADLDSTTLKKIYGEISDWGDRRRGIITTGDNRKASYEDLGKNACWIRLGEPTAESIRQAVLADEARITYDKPTIPSQRVLELRINSSLTGADFQLTLNDGFNTLIGGRGSGKSAILEYLRFAIGRSIVDTADDESYDRERDLIRSTLTGGFVEVDLDRDGVRETWRRTLEKQGVILVTSEGVSPIELPIPIAQERFRARAFSQKQLSTMVRRPETADEQITGIAAAESVDRRRQAEQDIDDAERAVRAASQQLVQSWAAQAAYNRAEAVTADLRRRLEAVRARLEEGGLTAEQQEILDKHPVYNRMSAQFKDAQREIADKVQKVNAIGVVAVSGWEGLAELSPVAGAREAITRLNDRVGVAVSEIIEALAIAAEQIRDAEARYLIDYSKFNEQYGLANQAQSHLATQFADFQRITLDLQTAEANLHTADQARGKFATAEEALAVARNNMHIRLGNLREVLNEASKRVEAMSNGVLRAHVEEETVPHRFMEALQDLCERSNIRDLELRCQERVSAAARDNRQGWEELIHHLQRVRRSRVIRGDTADISPDDIADLKRALGWDLTDNQARSVLARLDDDRLGKLLSAWALPFIRFEYKDRGSYMAFERASPGQQAAALLTLLLNQEAGTLIIDQPEDDLDNRVIMQIVKLLQTTKRKRQLIFATHNPNFVVNGDADKVVALVPSVEPNASQSIPSAQVTIEDDGSIETPAVRDAITGTMEGGLDAFQLRGRKYSVV
ncbi:AAA family ATPase [Mesorhizobium sp. CA6]|uniref:TrlF family AAA-like ATPase n=1 Tax=Mesorhizobium sp. CA6 TaxID=588500 RepID=UPI001CCA93C5|nr:AAA family ATPase [Mesorhizobium sp. CA6]MBZ9769983.1 AAA family ATPase [Mesorhizobium sp. CA6]